MKFFKLIIVIIPALLALFLPGLPTDQDVVTPLKAAVGGYSGKSLTQFATTLFAGSGVCAFCHTNLKDSKGNDVSMDTHWRSTMMANAANDPLWLAKVSSEVKRNPHLKDVIEEKCSTCHMPMAHTQAKRDGRESGILGAGFTSGSNDLHQAAMDGVSCTLCHQIANTNLGLDESYSGGYDIDQVTSKPLRPAYGPYTNSFSMPMQNLGGFTPTYSPHVNESELCATCHTLYTPYVDSQGAVLGEFPEQTPYLEWEKSRYAGKLDKSCQDCHMPLADGSVVISSIGAGMGRPFQRSPFFQHFFVGGNTFMLNVLKEGAQKLGLTASTENFDDTIARTLNQIQNNAATLKISAARKSGNNLEITLLVKNLAGHKFPTGIPIRRAWLELSVIDADNKTVFSSGAQGKNGEIAGNDADVDSDSFEPHYDVITDPSQVQIYEAIMANSDGEVTYTLLRAAEYLKDNRLLPLGFNKKKADADIAVYGKADDDKNFRGGADKVLYKVDISGYQKPFKISAKLHFQSVSSQFINDVLKDKTKEVRNFKKLIRKVDNTGEVVAEADKVVN